MWFSQVLMAAILNSELTNSHIDIAVSLLYVPILVNIGVDIKNLSIYLRS